MKINVIDLFSGCGGLTDGFLQTGKYNTLAAVDWELATIQTLKNRLSLKWNYNLNLEKALRIKKCHFFPSHQLIFLPK